MNVSLKTLAIADDDPGIQMALKAILTELGYTCVAIASTGTQAVDVVRSQLPQLILMDIHMPVLNGLAATKAIASLGTTAVVILTGDSNPALAREAMDAGACGYMQKPFDVSQMKAIFESAWHRFQTVHALQEENRLLSESLELRKLVEKAKGILMEQQGYSEEEAHKCLQKMSQDQGIPLKDVCRAVVQVRMVLGKGKSTANPSSPRRPAA